MARGAAEERKAATPASGGLEGWPKAWPLLAFLGFSLLALAIYRGALAGPFISDDLGYIVTHPYTEELSAEKVRAATAGRQCRHAYMPCMHRTEGDCSIDIDTVCQNLKKMAKSQALKLSDVGDVAKLEM